jgi:GNAT superfamily N-acetyltransferase
MIVMSVEVDKISPDVYPELRDFLHDANAVRKEPLKILMAVEDDIVHGMAIYEPGHIVYLYVVPESRRSGVATFLTQHVAAQSPSKKLTAIVDPNAVDAQCFFLQKGWRIENWFIGLDNKRYFRMTTAVAQPTRTPPVEVGLARFAKTVPIFISVGNKIL